MPLTHFPNGISTDNDQTLVVNFASASAAETVYTYVPFDATITNVTYVAGTASRVAAYTVKIGSAGTTLVNGVSNTTAAAGTTEDLTLSASSVSAGDSLSVARGVQGTTGVSQVAIVLQRV